MDEIRKKLNAEKQRRRYAMIKKRAEELGWSSWSTMITDIMHGRATVVKNSETPAQQ